MKIFIIILTLFLFSTGKAQAGYDIAKLVKAIDSIYPVWKINENKTMEEYGFQLIFNDNNSEEIEIPNFNRVLNGQSYTLLTCYGRIIPPSKYGYIIGTAIEGPTFGKIIIIDDTFQKIAEIDSQKVVKIKIINLLDEDALQIMTWEDHHYGTNTTRRVLNIYKIDHSKSIKNIFSHDIVDATFMPAGTDKEVYFKIDHQSLIKNKKIIVINENNNEKEIYAWDGVIYKVKTAKH